MEVNLHATMARSRANGPGCRFAIWFQGCSLGCPGCFNPGTHAAEPGQRARVDDLIGRILAEGGAIEGITVSGGEPFEQPDALLALAGRLRERAPHLSILVFSGFTRIEIERQRLGPAILGSIDVLIDGRFVERRTLGRGLRGSANQVIHLLSARYTREAVEATPIGEVVIAPDGSAAVTGVSPLVLPGARAGRGS